MSDHTKTKFGSDLEIVMSLDETQIQTLREQRELQYQSQVMGLGA